MKIINEGNDVVVSKRNDASPCGTDYDCQPNCGSYCNCNCNNDR